MSIAFLFSGQGAQVPGMVESLYKRFESARAVFDTADHVLGRSISGLCFSGSQDDLNMTHNTQPCMLAADLAVYAALQECGIKTEAVAGFSLGEYAALVAANVLSVEDAFRIIQIRADTMQDAVPVGQGSMAAIMNVDALELEALCSAVEGYVIPANYNSPAQTVVSGEAKAVDMLIALAKERKIRSVKLPVSAPFHCKLMEPARRKLEQVFNGIVFNDAALPIYMNVDGKAHIEGRDIKACVLQQTVSPVRWVDTIRNLQATGFNTFVELGVGKVLSGFVNKTLSNVEAVTVTDVESLNSLLKQYKH